MSCPGGTLPMLGCCGPTNPGGPLWSYLRAVVTGRYYRLSGNLVRNQDLTIGWRSSETGTITIPSPESGRGESTSVTSGSIDSCTGEGTSETQNSGDPLAYSYVSNTELLSRQVVSQTQQHFRTIDTRSGGTIESWTRYTGQIDFTPLFAACHARLAEAAFGESWNMVDSCEFVSSGPIAPIGMNSFPVVAQHAPGYADTSAVSLLVSKFRATFEGSYGVASFTAGGTAMTDCVSFKDAPPPPTLRHVVDVSPVNTGFIVSDRRLWLCPPSTFATAGRPACACV